MPLSNNKKNFDFKLTKFNVMSMKSNNFPSKMYGNWRVLKKISKFYLYFLEDAMILRYHKAEGDEQGKRTELSEQPMYTM